jgi:hypothetical protein
MAKAVKSRCGTCGAEIQNPCGGKGPTTGGVSMEIRIRTEMCPRHTESPHPEWILVKYSDRKGEHASV